MRPDLVIEARAFVRGSFTDVEIGLDQEHGKIVAVKKNLPGEPRRRFRGRLLVPSGVDLHVHFRDPGHPRKEDFRTGTLGAALGGVGTVFDMPNTDPVVDRKGRLDDKADTVAGKACVDWGLWATIGPGTRDSLSLLNAANGLKLFLAPTTGIPEPATTEELRARLVLAAKADRLVALHAEGGTAVHGARDLVAHEAARPASSEVEAIQRVRDLKAGGEIHVAHATTAEAHQAASKAGFSAAATPHHLLLSNTDRNLGTFGKVNPPLRDTAARERLWARFAAGQVPILETDHAPHTVEEKRRDFPDAPAGIPGVETAYGLLLREAREKGVDAAHVIRAYSEAPALRMGLAKGRIEPDHDADFFLFDPSTTKPIKAAELQSKCGWTPFEDWQSYRVETHFLAGDVVVEDGRFIGRPGRGRRIRPMPIGATRRPWGVYVAERGPAPVAKPQEPGLN